MTMHLREVDPRTERDRLVEFLGSVLPDHRGVPHFDWLYNRNPDGKARVWTLESGADGLVGVAAAFPRRVSVLGRPTIAWNLGDFAIRPDKRSLGPAVRLQRACLEPVLSGQVPFAYDHPSCNMMAIYRWLGIAPTGRVVRFARPLRIGARLRAASGGTSVPEIVGRVGDRAVGLWGRALRLRARSRAESRGLVFGEAFDRLDRRLRGSGRVVGVRDARYLDWRYGQSPNAEFGLVAVEGDEGLRGYAVHRRDGDQATIVDLVGDGDPDVLNALVGELVRVHAEAGAVTLSMPVLAGSRIAGILPEIGFRPRESANFVAATRVGGELDGVVNEPARWYHTDGDRDV